MARALKRTRPGVTVAGTSSSGGRPSLPAGLRAWSLVLPLAAFIGITFVAPLGSMLTRSVHMPVVADALPDTLRLLGEWDGSAVPEEKVFRALGQELLAARDARTLGQVATRVNRVEGGLRSVLTRTARRLRTTAPSPESAPDAGTPVDGPQTRAAQSPWRDTLVGIDEAWSEVRTWSAIERAGERFTGRHYLHALDLDEAPNGAIVAQAEDLRIYLPLLGRTFMVSLAVTALCLVLGYPVAYLIARAPPARAPLLLLLVLVPFWTSLLVRTTSWIVLLQTEGVVNDVLVAVGLLGEDGRLAMIYNMTGTMVAMTHVLLPFMVLPLYSVMRTVPPEYMRAAASLGAAFPAAFRRVYWPRTLPGVAAGCLLVFILAIGYYITPALVGGRTGQLISNMIAYHMQQSLNWGLAAALGGILLVCVLALYLAFDRLVGVERMRLGA